MTFLNAIYRNGIWLSVPLFVVSAGLLVFTLIGLVRLGPRRTSPPSRSSNGSPSNSARPDGWRFPWKGPA